MEPAGPRSGVRGRLRRPGRSLPRLTPVPDCGPDPADRPGLAVVRPDGSLMPARRERRASRLDVQRIDTPSLDNRSYLATDGRIAVVVDPPRDVDRVLALVNGQGLALRAVLDTHLHEDYVSGGLELARSTGARYVLSAHEQVSYGADRLGVRSGDLLLFSDRMAVRVVDSPGHSSHHQCFVLLDRTTDRPVAAFTGGSEWAAAGVERFPTHGPGSLSVEGASGADRLVLPAGCLRRVRAANRVGPLPVDLGAPPRASAEDLARRLADGEWLVDLRPRREFARRHVAGTLNFELDERVVSRLGWLLPAGTPLTVLAARADDVALVQRWLVRVGVDRVAAAAVGSPADWAPPDRLAGYRVATPADLTRALDRGVPVLEVRWRQRWPASALPGSVQMPLGELADRLHEVPGRPEQEVWVHGGGSSAAAVAASLLAGCGRRPVLVDGGDELAPAVSRLADGPRAAGA